MASLAQYVYCEARVQLKLSVDHKATVTGPITPTITSHNRSEIVTALRKGTSEWYEALCGQDTHSERGEDLVNLITLIQIDLQQGLTYYHPLFET